MLVNDNSVPHFDNWGDAFDWMANEVDDPCTDNFRSAYLDDDDSMRVYNDAKDQGYCGFFDAEVVVGGRPGMIGCNFGH